MEDQILPSSSPDSADSPLRQPRRDSWASVNNQYADTERGASEETEEWEQIIWPLRPMTCTSAPLSFATVQWDMPDPTTEMSFVMTDGNVDDEVSVGSSSPALPLEHEEREDDLRIDAQLLSSVLQKTGSDSEPCDAADVQQPTAQEKEHSPHELLLCDNEVSRTESEVEEEEEEQRSTASDAVETPDFTDILEESEGSGDETDSFIDLNLEEEQQEPCTLLTRQGDFEEEPSSPETEEGDGVQEKTVTEPTRTEEAQQRERISCVAPVEVPAEAEQADDTAQLITENRESQRSEREEDLEILQQSREDPTGPSEEPETCKDIDQNVDQCEAAEETEVLMETENGEEDVETLQEELEEMEEMEKLEELKQLEKMEALEKLEELEELEKLEEMETLKEIEQLEKMEELEEQEKLEEMEKMKELQQLEKMEELEKLEELEEVEERAVEDNTCSADPQQPQCVDQSADVNLLEEAAQPENADSPDKRAADEEVGGEAQQHRGQTEAPEQKEQTSRRSQATSPEQRAHRREADEPQTAEQLPTQRTEGAGPKQAAGGAGGGEGGPAETALANGELAKPPPHANGREADGETARQLAEQLFNLDGFQRVDVVKHLDKDNDFSRAVGEEYLKYFNFDGQTLDGALRSFLKVVVLIGETQERERVLQHFACRFHDCNPASFSSSGAALALTCALMLLNTDLHGQNVGKSMSSSKFVSNLDGMNEGKNFSKDLLKSLYNSIKSEPLEWAVDEGELRSCVFADEDAGNDAPLRSKANPFLDVPHDKKASEVKEGLLQRKLHADIDGKRIPWGKRGWKTFHGVLKGMVLYLQKVDYRRDHAVNEEVVSIHHSLAEQAVDYTKKPHVFRLQTADWRVFLFQASTKVEMNSWINRINLVSALQSSPPFPAAVGSQRKFFRPILPALQSAHTLERQLQSHSGMLESFRADVSYLQKNLPEHKKGKSKELEEHRMRAEYLHYEIRRYEIYIQVLEAYKSVKNTDDVDGEDVLSVTNLTLFDRAACADDVGGDDTEDGLTKSHSSPALPELPPQTVIKVKRNISERRTYRRVIIPRLNIEA